MKAIEYYVKYQARFFSPYVTLEDVSTAIKELLVEFSNEVKDIANTRHAKSDGAILSILKEQNQKWNALIRIFNKKRGVSPMKIDGFKNYWDCKLSEINGEE